VLKEVAFLKKKKIFGNLSKKYNKFRYKLEMKFLLTNFIFLKLFSVDSAESFIIVDRIPFFNKYLCKR